MRVVVAGGGHVGLFIANELAGKGHDVMILEQDPAVASRDGAAGRVDWRVADACEFAELQDAGLDEADVVVAATGDDEDNLVVCLLARQEFGVPRTVARVNHPRNEWLFNETWGVDVAVSAPHLITGLVEEAVTVGSLVRLLRLEGGAGLVEVTLGEESPAVDRPISELAFPRGATCVAVIRDQGVVVPRGDTVLYAGDEVLALTLPETETDVRKALVGD